MTKNEQQPLREERAAGAESDQSLTAESQEIEADDADRAEMLALAEFMESIRPRP